MANPWDNDPIVQQPNGMQVTTLPRNPNEVRRERIEDVRYNDERTDTREDRAFDNTKKFRDEFRGLPSVTEYNIALRTYNTAVNTPATAEGDQALITSFARLMDPNSVVREGEFATAAGNETAFEQIKAKLAKEFGMGGGRLTEEGRKRLRETMRGVVTDGFKAPYDRDRQQYSRYAEMEGVDPYLVVGEPVEAAFKPDLLDPPKVTEATGVATGDKKINKLPQEYQDAHYAYLRQNWGNLDPEAYTAFRTSLDQRYKQKPNPEAYRAFTTGANQVASEGGSPADLGAVPSPNVDMGFMGLESGLNTAAQSPTGAFFANMGNAGTGGLIVEATGNRDRLEDIRDINPGASFAGEVAGGITGTYMGGKALAGLTGAFPKASAILSNPAAANAAYGATYGATQDREDRWRGGVVGTTAALGGDLIGRGIGKTFPGLFNRGGMRAAEDAVPSVDDLQEQASQLYRQAEATGATTTPDATNDMIARAARILRDEGMLTPKDNIVGGSDVSSAMRMLNDFSDMPMTPTQVGSVRKTIGEGRTAMKDGAPDYNQRRIARNMLDEFDQWAEPALPGVDEARKVAQRAILGREMQGAIDLADAKTAMYSQSGEENALRNAFRPLDLNEVRGRNAYPEELSEAIQAVSRGTPAANTARWFGKFAPTGAVSAIPSFGASAIGGSALGPIGLAAGPALAGTGLFGRGIATHLTRQAAKNADLTARGGEAYTLAMKDVIEKARERAALFNAGLVAPSVSAATRGGDY